MLLGLYGRRGMHQDWVTIPFLTKKIFVDATERMQEFQAVQIDQPTIAPILGPAHWSPPPSLFLRVCLFVGEIGWMENFGEKMEWKTFLVCVWLSREQRK